MDLLQAKTDVGLMRDQNEDAVIAIKHPKNKNVKLLIAADGMGGRDKGEVASNYIVTSLEKWFCNKKIKILNQTNKVEKLLRTYIKKLNTNLIKQYGQDKLGTTLILALINKHNTLVINVGDSRAYIYRKRDLIQINEDDSDVWAYYKYGKVKKDHLRYFSNNSIVTACIGICNELCRITSIVIENDYDMIFLLTDGITDNITEKKIKKLVRKKHKEEVLDRLIYEAVYVNQHLRVPWILRWKYTANFVVPFPGRDNASGAIYIKEI